MEDLCRNELVLGDGFGDNPCTFICELPKGHSGSCKETRIADEKNHIIEWNTYINKEQVMVDFMYDLNLNEIMEVDDNTAIIRVPGGWIYETRHGAVFIPFDNEFQTKLK